MCGILLREGEYRIGKTIYCQRKGATKAPQIASRPDAKKDPNTGEPVRGRSNLGGQRSPLVRCNALEGFALPRGGGQENGRLQSVFIHSVEGWIFTTAEYGRTMSV